MENCIYLKTVHLNKKNATLVGAKDANSHTADLEGEIFQIGKNEYSSLLNKQQLIKYKEKRTKIKISGNIFRRTWILF